MSAYMVDDAHIDAIIEALRSARQTRSVAYSI